MALNLDPATPVHGKDRSGLSSPSLGARGDRNLQGNALAKPWLWLLAGMFRRTIRKGTLVLVGPDGTRHQAGSGAPRVTIRLVSGSSVRRVLFNPDLALGEAYMDGTLIVEQGDLYDFLALCFANVGTGDGHGLRRLRAFARRAMHRLLDRNPVPRARANVARHYDRPDTLYELFLDADRQYSCAYYQATDDTLEQAQAHKKRHVAAKLLLTPGQRVLDIGSGWGGFALYLARTAGVDVTGLTLSTGQLAYSQRCADEAGLGNRVRFRLEDYRQENGRYDRVVSIGMLEHVGIRHYREYFRKVRDLLADDGVALIHTIGSSNGPGAGQPWLRKYIFPGSHIPALSELVPAIERSGLHVTDIEVLRLHYAQTLKAWRERFLSNRQRALELFGQEFCRMWEFYLAGCEAAFRYSGMVVFQIQLSKQVAAVPLTRDYISRWEREHE